MIFQSPPSLFDLTGERRTDPKRAVSVLTGLDCEALGVTAMSREFESQSSGRRHRLVGVAVILSQGNEAFERSNCKLDQVVERLEVGSHIQCRKHTSMKHVRGRLRTCSLSSTMETNSSNTYAVLRACISSAHLTEFFKSSGALSEC